MPGMSATTVSGEHSFQNWLDKHMESFDSQGGSMAREKAMAGATPICCSTGLVLAKAQQVHVR